MTTDDPKLWGLHIGAKGDAERLFLTHGYIGLDYGKMGDLHLIPAAWDAWRSAYHAVYPKDNEIAEGLLTGQIYRFVREMRIGDYVAFRPKLTHNDQPLIFLGRVVGPYLYNPFLVPEYVDLRRVDWLRSFAPARLSKGAQQELNANLSFFQIATHAAEFFALIAESK